MGLRDKRKTKANSAEAGQRQQVKRRTTGDGKATGTYSKASLDDMILRLEGGGKGGGRGIYKDVDGDMPVARVWRALKGAGDGDLPFARIWRQ